MRLREELELVIDVGLDVFGTFGEPGKSERPKVDPREQVFAKASLANASTEVPIGAL